MCVRVCMEECEHVHGAAHNPGGLRCSPMLSGRLCSRDHEAAHTAAMNHCIIEPPLDRRGEEEGGGRNEKMERVGTMEEAGKGVMEVR